MFENAVTPTIQAITVTELAHSLQASMSISDTRFAFTPAGRCH